MRRTLRDWRWMFAAAVWAPCSRVEEMVDDVRSPKIHELTSDRHRLAAFLEMAPGFLESDLPVHLRILRYVVVRPLGSLSELIYPKWAADKRAKTTYWEDQRRA